MMDILQSQDIIQIWVPKKKQGHTGWVNEDRNVYKILCVNFKKSNSLFGVCVSMVWCSYVISIWVSFCVQDMRMWSCAAQRESSISSSQRGTYSLWPEAAGLCHTPMFPISFREVRTEREGVRIIFTSCWETLFLFTYNPFPTAAVTPRKTNQKRSTLVL